MATEIPEAALIRRGIDHVIEGAIRDGIILPPAAGISPDAPRSKRLRISDVVHLLDESLSDVSLKAPSPLVTDDDRSYQLINGELVSAGAGDKK